MRKLFRIVYAIQLVSGWTWDDETGASINIYTQSSWDDYVKVHPEAKPFRNKGWPLFRKMETLMPATVAGANVYHAATAPAPSTPAPPPPTATQPPVAILSDSDDDDDDPASPITEEQPNKALGVEEVRLLISIVV
jgi:hypothetical protein